VDYTNATTAAGVFGCEIWASAGTGTTFYGYGVNSGTGHTISGTVSGCSYGVNAGTGHTISGTVSGCSTQFGFDAGAAGQGLVVTVRGSATLSPTTPTFGNRDTLGAGSRLNEQVVRCEDYQGVLGASYAFHMTGDVIRTTATVRSGGADNSLEVIPRTTCAAGSASMRIFEWVELDVPASAQTKSVYVKGEQWTVFPTAAQLYLEAEYLSDDSPIATALATSTAVISDNTTWVALAVTFTPHIASRVRYRLYVGCYEGGTTRKVYIDNQLVTA
jgi:hypothetical protein